MIARKIIFAPVSAVLLLTGCVTSGQSPSTIVQSETSLCQTDVAVLDTNFPAGKAASCQVTGPNEFTLTIEPEDAPPINCSAWYAFRLKPREGAAKQRIKVNLNYEFCGHRYWPKSSTDGTQWDYLPKEDVTISRVDDVKQASLTIQMGDAPMFVSAQEIIVPATYGAWIEKMASSQSVDQWVLGTSAEGRDIPVLTLKHDESNPKRHVVLIGRQHPPEITGALAMLPFVETLNADTELARRYRLKFTTVVVPMLNPDGVVRGYWRHNTGSTDLNRDWGPFKQPETRLMDNLLKKIASDPDKELSFFADFHSTQNDIFYTIPDEFQTKPNLFIKSWLGRLQERMPDYKVKRSANANLKQANSKNYVYRTYGVPTVTYEMGDETNRELIKKIANEAATAMMETLLASEVE
ncbi:MAG: M14-type cytosolic carboxypeptidase [Parasphingorhabdus sp.]